MRTSTIKKLVSKNNERGFTLIELMIVVAIVGVLAVLAVYGVRKYLANAKTAEARATVGQIGKLAVVAYERESGTVAVVALGTPAAANQRNLCTGTASVWTPATTPANRKHQSSPAEWNTGSQTDGWQCLKFNMDNPQYYSYQYTSAAGSNTFTSQARGDLNGDGVLSNFSLAGAVTNGVARTAPNMAETNPEE